MNYRIYANNRIYGWELLTILYKEELIEKFTENINPIIYDKILIISHNIQLNMDSVYDEIFLEKPLVREKNIIKG